MHLKRLEVRRLERYEKGAGSLIGKVEFEDENGALTVHLDDATSQRVLEACAEGVAEKAREVAGMMRATVITAVPAIENKAA